MGKATLRVSPELWLELLREPGNQMRRVVVDSDAIPAGATVVDVRVAYPDVEMVIEADSYVDGQVLRPTCRVATGEVSDVG
jgi:hypothetical protein